MIKITFADASGYESEQEMTSEEIKLLNDLKPKIYGDIDEYRLQELQYNIESNTYTAFLEKL